MVRHLELASDARASYIAGRIDMAALQYCHAAQIALDLGDRIAWYQCTAWAAASANEDGDHPNALSLLLTARSAEPDDVPEFERWLTRVLSIEILLDAHPEVGRLHGLLDDLRAMTRQRRTPAADVYNMEGRLHVVRGEWADALRCYETAWRVYDGSGEGRSTIAAWAGDCCLRLGQWVGAADWVRACTSTCEEDRGAARHNQAELHLKLALATGAEAGELMRRLRDYTDRAHAFSQRSVADGLRELTVRVTVLVPTEGDLVAINHPARQELRRRWHRIHSVHGRYDARLLLLDYRLACLRHAIGVPPVDDFYYATPQEVPLSVTPAEIDDFAHRLHLAHAAANWAMHYARYLDGLLECDWRQREVRSRIERINEIQKAAGG